MFNHDFRAAYSIASALLLISLTVPIIVFWKLCPSQLHQEGLRGWKIDPLKCC